MEHVISTWAERYESAVAAVRDMLWEFQEAYPEVFAAGKTANEIFADPIDEAANATIIDTLILADQGKLHHISQTSAITAPQAAIPMDEGSEGSATLYAREQTEERIAEGHVTDEMTQDIIYHEELQQAREIASHPQQDEENA